MDRAILISIFSFSFGILLSSFVFVSPLIAVLVCVVGGAAWLAEKIIEGKARPEVLILSLTLISSGFGILRYDIKDFHKLSVPMETGVVVSEPAERENARRFVFLADNNERVLVTADLYSPVEYGDRVSVSGEFKRPGIITDEDTGKEFDYGTYLSKDDIYYTLGFARIEVLAHEEGNPIKARLFRLKRSLVEHAKKILPEPESSLLSGLIVSGKEAMPKDVLEEFRRAGIIHIVVLSGFNITLIADFLRKLFQTLFIHLHLPAIPQAAALASTIGIILFVIMTGAEATVVRAALMALIVIGGKLLGRSYSAPRALVFAACLMLLENPKILVFDRSFQLSFLATAGLIYFLPPIERQLGFITKRFKLREVISQTLATQTAVLPVLLSISGSISPVFLPANILVLLAVPWTMLVGFTAILVSYISIIAAWPFSYTAHVLLAWILLVARLLGGV